MGKFSELDIVKHDLKNYADECCNGDMIESYKDEINYITEEVENFIEWAEKVKDIKDLLLADKWKRNEVHKRDVKKELARLDKALAKIKTLI